jgi:hypothetical protein
MLPSTEFAPKNWGWLKVLKVSSLPGMGIDVERAPALR